MGTAAAPDRAFSAGQVWPALSSRMYARVRWNTVIRYYFYRRRLPQKKIFVALVQVGQRVLGDVSNINHMTVLK
jgi:hypothetical protein